MELKENGTLALGQVYRKLIHNDRYLNAESHHHSAQKQSVINTLVYRAIYELFSEEMDHEKERGIKRIPVIKEKVTHRPTRFLSYIYGCTDKIGCTSEKIEAVFLKTNSSSNILHVTYEYEVEGAQELSQEQ